MRTDAFLDTSVLLYAMAGHDKRSAAALAALEAGGLISVQVVCEFTSIARHVLGRSWPEVYEALSIINILCPEPLPVRWSTYEKALELMHQEGLFLQDALIAASALQAGCNLLLTGLYADGCILAEQLTVSNPFGPRAQH